MKPTPISREIIDQAIADMGIADFSRATIREVVAVAQQAEKMSGFEFVKMEMGVPGLPPSAVGVKAQVDALNNGIARLYPNINGLPELKEQLGLPPDHEYYGMLFGYPAVRYARTVQREGAAEVKRVRL